MSETNDTFGNPTPEDIATAKARKRRRRRKNAIEVLTGVSIAVGVVVACGGALGLLVFLARLGWRLAGAVFQ